LHDGVELGLRPLDVAFDGSAVRQSAAKSQRPDRRQQAGKKARGRDCELDLRIEREQGPRGCRSRPGGA
jgi:hypothetical protein